MTPEQELTAMIEAELYRQLIGYVHRHNSMQAYREWKAVHEMPDPTRQQAALSKLYWLATDPDDMVH